MKKRFLSIITITLSISIIACSTSVGESDTHTGNTTELEQQETTTNEETTVETTTPVATEPTTPEPTTPPPTTTQRPSSSEGGETTTMEHIDTTGQVAANSITEHGKELKLYGNLSMSDERLVQLKGILDGYSKRISLVVWRKDGSKALSYNTNQTFFSACTIKAGYMLNVCKMIDSGVIDENTVLTYKEKHYHRGSGKIRKGSYGDKYTVKELIHLALSISDNVAYKMLIDYCGFTEYNAMVDRLGCSSIRLSDMWARKAKTKDYVIVWNEIYDYLTSDAKMVDLLREACTNTPFNYGTETLVGADYSHKSGDNFGASAVYNDAGIVWEDNTYIYAVFTNSEGTSYDIKTVNSAMDLVNSIMKED